MSFSFSRTRPAAWLAAAVLLVSCSSSIDGIVAPQMRVPGPSFQAGGTIPTMAITEFIANPDGTDDPFEWFEVWNGSGTTVNMKGMVFSSFGGSAETGFTVNTDMFVPDGQYALFVRSGQGPAPTGVPRFVYGAGAGTDKLILNNSNTDWVTIKTTDGALVDSLAYAVRTNGVAGSFTPTNGTARAKRKPVRDCSVAADGTAWANATTAVPGRPDKGTPGVLNDVTGYTYTGTCGTTLPPSIGPLDHVTTSGANVVNAGSTITLTAFAEDAENDRISGATFTWASANEAIATVSATGVVRGILIGGPIAITATTTVGGITKTGTHQVTVQIPTGSTSISFSGRTPSDPPVPVGFQDQLFANKAGTTVTSWESLTPDIATIDARGVFTAKAAGNATFKVTMSDGTFRTTTLPMEVGTTGDAALYGNNALFGAPTLGGSDSDLLVTRPQYTLSYNKGRGGPNWVAYRLNKQNRGNLPGYRCDCFTTDPAVTAAGEVGLTTADYTGSGFDRGHMVRSNDRELGTRDQAATYYLSNIVPQWDDQNQGRWGDLESHLQTVSEGAGLPDVYILTGGRGEASRIAAGRIAVPTHTWKVALVVKAGATLASIDDPTDILDVIAVDMPNVNNLPRDGNWQAHRVTVDSVEKATGYDVLALLSDYVENIIESGDRRPTASYTGTTSGNEGVTLNFTSTSTDADVGTALGDVLSYQWSIDGAAKSIEKDIIATFPDDGSYAVQLIVSDRFGWADTTEKTVTIANVAPTVDGFAGTTILRGERYDASGTFSDPGADSWTATVNYGDGSGARSLALSGKSFTLSHAYATPGTFGITVSVRDDDAGTGTRTVTVVVLSADQAIDVLSDRVRAANLSTGESNALDASLRAALKSLDKDNPTPAQNQLEAFINKVEAMQQSGRITAATATALTDYARRIVASM